MDGSTTAAACTCDPIGLPASATAHLTRTTKFLYANTELATAIMTALPPSNLAGSGGYSRGAQNVPGILENNASGTQRVVEIRGLLGVLKESTVAVERWSLGVCHATLPLGGFNDLFARGRFPHPADAKLMSYHRVDFNDINPPPPRRPESPLGPVSAHHHHRSCRGMRPAHPRAGSRPPPPPLRAAAPAVAAAANPSRRRSRSASAAPQG